MKFEDLYKLILENTDEEAEEEPEYFKAGLSPDDYDGKAPRVDWDEEDNYGYSWNKQTVKKHTHAAHDYIYPAMLYASDLDPKLVEFEEAKEIQRMRKEQIRASFPDEFMEEDPDDEDAPVIDWTEVRDRKAWEARSGWEEGGRQEMSRVCGSGYPPAVVTRIDENKYEIIDGNHRIDTWQECGFDMIPAWVVDNWLWEQVNK